MENIEYQLDFNVNIGALIDAEESLGKISRQIQEMKSPIALEIIGVGADLTSIGSFVTGIMSLKGYASKGLKGFNDTMKGEKGKIKETGKSLGQEIAEGLISGLKGSKFDIEKTCYDVFGNVESAAMKRLEIKSPSRVMKRIGEYITEGLGDGIKSGSKDIRNAMGDVTDTVEKTSKKMSKTKFSIGGIAAVASIVASLVGYFVNILSTNESLSEKMGEIWEKICEVFEPVQEAVMSLFDSFLAGGEGTTSMFDKIIEIVGNVATIIGDVITQIVTFFQENSEVISGIVSAVWEVISGIVDTAKGIFATLFEVIGGFFAEHGEAIMEIIGNIWGFISEILDGAAKIFGGVFEVIVGIFTGNGEKIKKGFKKIWEGIKGIFSGMGEFFSGIWDKVVSIFKKVGTRIGDAIGGAFKAVVNAILSFAEGVINKFIKAINFAIKAINLIPGVNIKKLDLLVIPKLAQGGMLDAGQVFVAREAGPELVGNFGSKTAVMNNNQIVESVSRGVFEAVRSAMSSGSGSYTFNITNTLDGKEIGKQVIKYHNGVVRQTGISPLYI